MKIVYLLQHSYEYGKNGDYTETKVLGIYSERKKANDAVLRYRILPGFKDYSDECFSIDEYILDNDGWKEGFEGT